MCFVPLINEYLNWAKYFVGSDELKNFEVNNKNKCMHLPNEEKPVPYIKHNKEGWKYYQWYLKYILLKFHFIISKSKTL